MSNDEKVSMLIGLAIGVVVGVFAGCMATESRNNADAIKHHAAHYDSVTGEFKWNDPLAEKQP